MMGDAYDPNEIVTRAQDDHGHSVNPRVTLPKTWNAVLAQIVNSDDWPEYRTTQDVIRDALYHRFHWINTQKDRHHIPEVQAAIIRARYLRRLENHLHEALAWDEFRKKIDQVLLEQINEGNEAGVRDFIEDFRDEIRDVPEPHRTKLQKQLDMWAQRAGLDW